VIASAFGLQLYLTSTATLFIRDNLIPSVTLTDNLIPQELDCVHQSPAVANEEQERRALVYRFRPAEKNRLVKNVLLEKDISKQPLKKGKIEEENVPSMCYTFF
jgi:hypothetical protein